MLKRRHIAVLIAGLFVGAQVGLAGVSESTGAAEQEYSEPAPVQAEYLEPATAQSEAVDQVAVTTSSMEEPRGIGARLAAIGARIFAPPVSGNAFPPSADDHLTMLPAQIAYFDRLEASRSAGGNQWVAANADAAFPRSDGEFNLLPSVISHFDRLEPSRFATVPQTMSGSSDISLASANE